MVIFLIVIADLLWIIVKFPTGSQGRIFLVSNLPMAQVPVLVLGAGVLPDREPTQVLQARLETALTLYQQDKASWVLVSGDNRALNYNEPRAMRKYLLRRGVPDVRVVCDFAGRRTYDSIKRAQAVFGVKKLIIVTSDFHLPRALFLAKHLGLDACGVASSTEILPLSRRISFWGREYVARHLATWDGWFPPDTMLGPREATPDDRPGNEAR